MAVFSGGKKGEMAFLLNGLVGKSVNSELENWVGGRKWENLIRSFKFNARGFIVGRFVCY
jgi:hypothetical protein